MKKIAVLGANGYIARNLIYVLKRDHPDCQLQLYGLEDHNIDGYEEYTSLNMTKIESVRKIDLSCDIVFMFVGKTGSANGFEDYDSFIDINEKTLLNLLSECKRTGSKAKIVFPSTRLVYKGKKGPQNELSENEFKTIYAMNKFACEQYLKQFNQIYGIQYAVLRICVPYGTLVQGARSYGTADFMISKAREGKDILLYGNGEVRRTVTYIEDLCNNLIDSAFSESCLNDIYNIGGEDYSLKEMAELIASKYNVSVEYVPWPDLAMRIESGDTVFDSSKLEKIIGKREFTSFADWVKTIKT